MALLFLRDMFLSYGTHTLLNKVSFKVDTNERVCIVGRNGEGKSTLLKVIEGSVQADDGTRIVQDGVKIAKLQQEVPNDLAGSVFHIIALGLGDIGHHIEEFHRLSHAISENYTDELMI